MDVASHSQNVFIFFKSSILINLKMFKLVLYCMVYHFTKGDLITPKTVPSLKNISEFEWDSEHRQSILKNKKPWKVYIDSNLNHSLSICLLALSGKIFFDQFRKCLFNCSPTCKYWERVFQNGCPSDDKVTNIFIQHPTLYNQRIFNDHWVFSPKSELANLTAIRNVLGKIIIETDKCSTLLRRWDEKFRVKIKLLFKTDATLRVNITFTRFQLIKKEIAQLLNFDENMFDHVVTQEPSFFKQVK